MTPLTRQQIAWRAAQDLPDGAYVNLGIGLPTLVANYVPPDREVVFHSENGILGMGPAPASATLDPDLINAGKDPVTLLPGGSFFNHNDAFLMIRGGHIDVALMGAFEVSETGDLANWSTDDADVPPGVGGAMDLAVGAKAVRVLLEHSTKTGKSRVRKVCGYSLTAARCVSRIYTNLAVLDLGPDGLIVQEMIDGLDFETLRGRTEARLILAPACRPLQVPSVPHASSWSQSVRSTPGGS